MSRKQNGLYAHNQRQAAAAGKRRKKAVNLRRKGWTLAEIGEKFGCSKQRVYAMLLRV